MKTFLKNLSFVVDVFKKKKSYLADPVKHNLSCVEHSQLMNTFFQKFLFHKTFVKNMLFSILHMFSYLLSNIVNYEHRELHYKKRLWVNRFFLWILWQRNEEIRYTLSKCMWNKGFSIFLVSNVNVNTYGTIISMTIFIHCKACSTEFNTLNMTPSHGSVLHWNTKNIVFRRNKTGDNMLQSELGFEPRSGVYKTNAISITVWPLLRITYAITLLIDMIIEWEMRFNIEAYMIGPIFKHIIDCMQLYFTNGFTNIVL